MKLSEQEQEVLSKIDDQITKILTFLRDHDFKNSKTRQDFAQLIVRLCLSKDPRSRLAIKRIGDFFSSLGTELLNMYDENGNKINGKIKNEENMKLKKYESIFKEKISKKEVQDIIKNIIKITIKNAEGRVGKKDYKNIADIQRFFNSVSKPDLGYYKYNMIIELKDGNKLNGFRYDHGEKYPSFSEQLFWYLENNITIT